MDTEMLTLRAFRDRAYERIAHPSTEGVARALLETAGVPAAMLDEYAALYVEGTGLTISRLSPQVIREDSASNLTMLLITLLEHGAEPSPGWLPVDEASGWAALLRLRGTVNWSIPEVSAAIWAYRGVPGGWVYLAAGLSVPESRTTDLAMATTLARLRGATTLTPPPRIAA